MTFETPDDAAPPPGGPQPNQRRSNRFFRKSRAPLALDDARRQGDITQLAFSLMGGRDRAVAFLNADDAELGGRPLAIATASPEGYERVAAAIRAREQSEQA